MIFLAITQSLILVKDIIVLKIFPHYEKKIASPTLFHEMVWGHPREKQR